jgi:enterochelin esterase-like enzyme
MMFFGAMRWGSAVEIPARDQEFYALKNVPHGQLREVFFHSKSTDSVRRAFVYTPPGYDQNPDQRYPVLYLQHGWGENEYGWGVQGRAAWIMDNLIAENRIRPFIIVMTYGMTNDIRFGGLRNFDIGPFETVLVRELIPYIDAHFRTLSDQPNRAMAGLSMGGMETKMITLRHLDTFSHIGLFSGGSISPTDISDLAAFKEKNKLVFVSYGSRELGGNRGGGGRPGGDPKANVEALKAAGINSHFYVSPETAHEWQTWRRSLHAFAQLLFQDRPREFLSSHQMTGPPARPAPASRGSRRRQDPISSASRPAPSKAGQDADGNEWLADQGFEGGQPSRRPDPRDRQHHEPRPLPRGTLQHGFVGGNTISRPDLVAPAQRRKIRGEVWGALRRNVRGHHRAGRARVLVQRPGQGVQGLRRMGQGGRICEGLRGDGSR